MPFIPARIAEGSSEFTAECKPKIDRERKKRSRKGKVLEQLLNCNFFFFFFLSSVDVDRIEKIQNSDSEA